MAKAFKHDNDDDDDDDDDEDGGHDTNNQVVGHSLSAGNERTKRKVVRGRTRRVNRKLSG